MDGPIQIGAAQTGDDDFPVLLEITVIAPVGFLSRCREALATLRGMQCIHRAYLTRGNVEELRKVLGEP